MKIALLLGSALLLLSIVNTFCTRWLLRLYGFENEVEVQLRAEIEEYNE